MSEIATQVPQNINLTPKVNLAELPVKPEAKFKENRGLQAALLCANENFVVAEADQNKIAERLQKEPRDRWDFKLFDKASREERKTDKGPKLPEWKNQMIAWLKDQEQVNNKDFQMYKQVLCKISGIDSEKFQINDQSLEQIIENVYRKGGGMAVFVEGALKIDNLKNEGAMQLIKDLASSFFGDNSAEVISQIVSLESSMKSKSGADLAGELFAAGKNLKDNPDAIYLVNELKKLLSESKKDTVNVEMVNSMKIAGKQIIGGRDHQQDFILAREQNLPAGIKSIAIVTDGHSADGENAGRSGGQYFESKFLELKTNNPDLSIEECLKQAVVYTDQRLVKEYPLGGTTLTAVVETEGKAYFVNVGDSKAFIESKGVLTKVTTDHNLGGDQANILTRSLGDATSNARNPEPDIFVKDIAKGDKILLCSDGMNLENDQISQLISGKSPDDATSALIDAKIKKNPDGDNTSVAVLQV